jgi:hypothetical protein
MMKALCIDHREATVLFGLADPDRTSNSSRWIGDNKWAIWQALFFGGLRGSKNSLAT